MLAPCPNELRKVILVDRQLDCTLTIQQLTAPEDSTHLLGTVDPGDSKGEEQRVADAVGLVFWTIWQNADALLD
jgi:hypothetical protein